MENAVLKAIKERRSVKNYISDRQVEDEKLTAVLEAGTYAASGMGRQSPVFVAVQNSEDREALRKMNAKIMGCDGTDPFYGAPTVIVVLADKNAHTHTEDGSLAIGNMMLAAESMGLSSCWIHRAKEEFETDEGKKLLKKWGLSENYVGIGHCILGYSDSHPEAKPRKSDYFKIIK